MKDAALRQEETISASEERKSRSECWTAQAQRTSQ